MRQRRNLAFAFAVVFAACGAKSDPASTADAAIQPDAHEAVPCGSLTCSSSEYCEFSCTGSPFYCEAPTDAGTCPEGYRFAQAGCYVGPGGNSGGGGCSNVEAAYRCLPQGDLQAADCPRGGETKPISNGVLTCCGD